MTSEASVRQDRTDITIELDLLRELCFTGDKVSAEEALRIGLVNRVVPADQLMAETMALAAKLAALPARGIALTKRTMWAGLETNSLRAAIELETHTQLFVRLTTNNFEEAVRARKENRPPVFED